MAKKILYPVLKENFYHTRDWIDTRDEEPIHNKKGELSAAKGSLVYHPERQHEDVEWIENKVFEETLEYKGNSRGRSSATFNFEGSNRAHYTMFMKDLDEVMKHKDIINRKIEGLWTYCKRGHYYGIRLANEKETNKYMKNKD